MSETFKPTLFVKQGCPHCFKVRLFLLESGQLDDVNIRQFVPGEQSETELKAELEPHFEKVTFPAAEIAPGEFMNESDDIIAVFAKNNGTDPQSLPTFQAYLEGPFKRLRELFKQLRELKEKAA